MSRTACKLVSSTSWPSNTTKGNSLLESDSSLSIKDLSLSQTQKLYLSSRACLLVTLIGSFTQENAFLTQLTQSLWFHVSWNTSRDFSLTTAITTRKDGTRLVETYIVELLAAYGISCQPSTRSLSLLHWPV